MLTGCQDVYKTASCKQWAVKGECKKNPSWMEVNCPQSCLVCGKEINVNFLARSSNESVQIRKNAVDLLM